MKVSEILDSLLCIATCSTTCYPDEQIQVQTKFPNDDYKPLTSIFVRFPEGRRFGTRSHTLIVVDKNDQVTVLERRMEVAERLEDSTWHDKIISFLL